MQVFAWIVASGLAMSAIAGAAVDEINPCAFAVLVILITARRCAAASLDAGQTSPLLAIDNE